MIMCSSVSREAFYVTNLRVGEKVVFDLFYDKFRFDKLIYFIMVSRKIQSNAYTSQVNNVRIYIIKTSVILFGMALLNFLAQAFVVFYAVSNYCSDACLHETTLTVLCT